MKKIALIAVAMSALAVTACEDPAPKQTPPAEQPDQPEVVVIPGDNGAVDENLTVVDEQAEFCDKNPQAKPCLTDQVRPQPSN